MTSTYVKFVDFLAKIAGDESSHVYIDFVEGYAQKRTPEGKRMAIHKYQKIARSIVDELIEMKYFKVEMLGKDYAVLTLAAKAFLARRDRREATFHRILEKIWVPIVVSLLTNAVVIGARWWWQLTI